MNDDNIDQWAPLAEQAGEYEWDPGFEGDRWVVISRIGPFEKIFIRPEVYTRRFFHKAYNLPVEQWKISSHTKLFGGLSSVKADISILFQPTIKYVERNVEVLPEVGPHIRANYETVVKDIVERALLDIEEGKWMGLGLEKIERAIETSIHEMLIVQFIQSRANCKLEPHFEELSSDKIESMSGHLKHQSAYLELVRQKHEFYRQREQEIHHQNEQLEQAKLEHETNMLEQFRRDEALRKTRDREETERVKAQLYEEEKRLVARESSEERRHSERIKHETLLREMEMDAKIKERDARMKAAKKTDDMLRREIELLVLEKQRHTMEEELEEEQRDSERRKINGQASDS